MGKVFRGFEPEQSPGVSRQVEAEASADTRSPAERLVEQRWKAIESLAGFCEREAEDALAPERFIAEKVQAWERRQAGSENFNTRSPFELVNALLALVVEQGAEWPAQKLAAVRRIIYGFAKKSISDMFLEQQGIINRTILSDPQTLNKIGTPRPDEQELIDSWLQNTVGRGVK